LVTLACADFSGKTIVKLGKVVKASGARFD
jgi:hypothetical protein